MRVFISHSHETKGLAEKLGEELRRAGMDVWNYEVDILPGDNWAQKIGQALESSQAMVALLTPEALNSRTVLQEIQYALGNKTFNKRLIPVLVGSEDNIPIEKLPWILKHLNVIRLAAYGTQEAGIERITQALQAVA
ncbi:MAG TPA: toll/interleukin-1 receptor domain-containing protein [Pyrinomonadaceae bacterium]|nr:toll/interleukin-1 receptor domain-containing protein [Pyrinomonadaceae bacterium]